MKKLVILAALAGLAAGATVANADSAPGTGISNSKHDMRLLKSSQGAGIVEAKDRVCAFCHTPHHKLESDALDYNPLWSHEVSTGAYTQYDSVTFLGGGTRMASDPLVGPSRLCMSCHDGVIAPDQHYNTAGTNYTGNDHMVGNDFGQIAVGLGGQGQKTHPIGFDITGYPNDEKADTNGMSILGNAGLRANLVAPNTPLNNAVFTSVGWNKGDGKLYFTCLSCHDVHNRNNQGEYFLYASESGSAICLMCHDK